MKKLVVGAVLIALAGPVMAKEVSVRGYVRSDGTYVQPHQQTAPNDTRQDNWSSKPNVNPYTGKQGTVDPWTPKAPASPRW